MIRFLGRLTIGAMLPALLDVAASIDAVFDPIAVDLAARVGGYTRIAAKYAVVAPSISGSITLTKNIAAAFDTAIQIGPPAVDFAFKAVARHRAKLEAKLAKLEALLALTVDIATLSGQAGVKVFLYEGPLGDLTATLSASADGLQAQAGIAGSVPVYVPLFVVDGGNGTTKAALQTVMGL